MADGGPSNLFATSGNKLRHLSSYKVQWTSRKNAQTGGGVFCTCRIFHSFPRLASSLRNGHYPHQHESGGKNDENAVKAPSQEEALLGLGRSSPAPPSIAWYITSPLVNDAPHSRTQTKAAVCFNLAVRLASRLYLPVPKLYLAGARSGKIKRADLDRKRQRPARSSSPVSPQRVPLSQPSMRLERKFSFFRFSYVFVFSARSCFRAAHKHTFFK